MPDHRQKQRAKQKRKRSNVGRPGLKMVAPGAFDAVQKQLLAHMPSLLIGPCFITRGWQVPSKPRIHCIVATRFLDAEELIPAAILVDLGCEGVRDAYLAEPTPARGGLKELLEFMQQMFPAGFEEIPPGRASALVEHAIAYAAEIGLEVPSRAKPVLAVLSEYRDPTFECELGRRGKRLYSPRPGEDTKPMVKRLVETVGPNGFEVVLPSADKGAPKA